MRRRDNIFLVSIPTLSELSFSMKIKPCFTSFAVRSLLATSFRKAFLRETLQLASLTMDERAMDKKNPLVNDTKAGAKTLYKQHTNDVSACASVRG